MPQPVTPSSRFGTGSRLFDIPSVPTVARDPLGRWSKLTEEIVYYYKTIAAKAINDFTNQVADLSLLEVPRSFGVPMNPEEASVDPFAVVPNELADSIKFPRNDPGMRAHPDLLWAQVKYTADYAAVQHEGAAEMLHLHPIIPGSEGYFEKTDVAAPVLVRWVAKSYSTPGTKDHYLSDPEKAMIPLMETFIGNEIRAKLGLF